MKKKDQQRRREITPGYTVLLNFYLGWVALPAVA